MSENPLANIQPSAAPEPPAPAAPEPPAPAAPEPPTPPADDNKPADADKVDAAEWAAAAKDLFPDLEADNKPEDKNDEPVKPAEKPATPEAPADGKTGDKPPEPGDEGAPKNGDETPPEDEPVAPSDAIARRDAREQREAVEAVKNDVREKMFKDAPTQLKAGDGGVLDSVDAVMQYTNPATNEPFTRDEATLWLAQAERQFEKQTADMEKQLDSIVEVQLDLKDQADVVSYEYGELLQAMPELQKKLWGEYQKTLTQDPNSGIITKAPVSLQEFYAAALEPYAQLGRQLEQQETEKAAADAQAAEAAKQQQEQAKQQRRQDRSDIYGPGKVDTQTDEDKEWATAAEAVFGKLN